METKKFNPVELSMIYQHAQILRAMNALPMGVAAKVNRLGVLAMKVKTDIIDEELATAKDRKNQIKLMPEGEERTLAEQQFDADMKEANFKKYDFDFEPISIAEFGNIEIVGEKIVFDERGQIGYSYRDSYFDLLNMGLIK